MDLYLAYSSSNSAASSTLSWTVGVVVVIAVGLVLQWVIAQMRKIRGPVVEGTAEVLSLRQFGRVGSGAGRQICRLRLRVSTAGQVPYDVTVWRNIAPWNVGAFQKGCTIAV